MTGQIIPFQTFRYREEGPAHQGPASRRDLRDDLARPIGSQSDLGPPVRNTRILKLQVARIAQLLDELEELARTSHNVPPAIVGHAHAGIERARSILPPCSESERTAGRENSIEDDPQPDVDGEMLERMYRKLNPDAQMPRFHALDVDVQRNVTQFAIELFLQELAEQRHAPDEWQKAAADDAIAAFHRGQFEHALTCIDLGETPPDQRSPLSTFTKEETRLSLRDLWQRFICCCSASIRPEQLLEPVAQAERS